MAGNNFPMIIGQTMKRDHIHWPKMSAAEVAVKLGQGDVLPQFTTIHRPPCNLEQIMALVFRVKEWTLSGTWSATAHDGFGSQSISRSFDDSAFMRLATRRPENATARHEIINEKFIASQIPGSSASVTPRYITDFFYPLRNLGFIASTGSGAASWHYPMTPSGFSQIFFFLDAKFDSELVTASGISYGVDLVVFESGVFKPFFYYHDAVVQGSVSFQNVTPYSSLVANSSLIIDPVICDEISAELNISVGTPAILDSFDSDLKLTASKFFPYSNSLGEAIYDEFTGVETGADAFA